MTTIAHPTPVPADHGLPPIRLHAMRGAYLVIAVGLAVVKWPLLPHASTLPLYESVTLCMLVAMSLLALLGIGYPVRMLPVLLFESTWKLLWLGLVALPKALSGTLDDATAQTVVNCSLVVVVVAAVPWPYVWRRLLRSAADR